MGHGLFPLPLHLHKTWATQPVNRHTTLVSWGFEYVSGDSLEGLQPVRLGRGRGQRWVWLHQLRWVCRQPFAAAETTGECNETMYWK